MSFGWRFSPVLLALCLSCAGCVAAQAREGPAAAVPSLIVGQWLRFEDLGQPGCEGDAICLDILVDARIAHARTLSGPEIPPFLTVRLWIHSDPEPGSYVIMAVRRSPPGAKWTGKVIHLVRPAGETCLSMETLREIGIEMPAGRRRGGKWVCLPVRME
jgi:hypothetical protein